MNLNLPSLRSSCGPEE